MKIVRFIALVGIMLAAGTAAAQEYAPTQGDFSVELQFNPFADDFNTFQLEQLKARYFFNDNNALRFGLGFGFNSDKTTPDPDEDKYWGKETTSNFSVNLGLEHHFFNYQRVDLYLGGSVGYAMRKADIKESRGKDEYQYHNYVGNANDLNNRAYNEFGVKAFTGIDFYVYKGLYVGAEFGLKFSTRSYPGYYSETDERKGDPEDKVSSLNLATFAEGALRIGWTF